MNYNIELRNDGALPIPIAIFKGKGFVLSQIDGQKSLMMDVNFILVNENQQLEFSGKDQKITIMPQGGLLIRLADADKT